MNKSPDLLWGDTCSKSTADKQRRTFLTLINTLPRVKWAATSECREYPEFRKFDRGGIPPTFNGSVFILNLICLVHSGDSEHAHDKTMFCFLVNGAMEAVLLPQNQH